MDKEQIFKEAMGSILEKDKKKAEEIAKRAISEGFDPIEVINEGFRVGIIEVGNLFERGEVFLPELIQAAEVMKISTDILMKALPQDEVEEKGTIVIGTVQGDIHDIGKTIVVTMLQVGGFRVYDLGHDVETSKLIEKAQEVNADIIGTSALLTTTMKYQKILEEELRKAGLREKFKTIVGGAPVTQRWADRIGADAYAENASEAVKKALQLVNKE